MTAIYLLHFLLGLVSSFLGTLPFGTINLSVVSTTINQSFRAGFTLSVAAAMVEILQSFIAFHFSVWIIVNIQQNLYVQLGVVLVFVVIGLYFFTRKPSGNPISRTLHLPNFARGILLGLFNPQALPFWVFVIAWLQSMHLLQIDSMEVRLGLMLIFFAGVSIGKLGALTLYGALSVVIVRKMGEMGRWMNKILAIIFFLLAMIQGGRLLI